MTLSNRIKPIPMSSVDAATLDPAAWTELKVPVEKPLSILHIYNISNTAITISYDPDPDPLNKEFHDFMTPDSTLELNLQANHIMPSNVSNLAKGTGIWIQGNAGIGTIYCSGLTSYE